MEIDWNKFSYKELVGIRKSFPILATKWQGEGGGYGYTESEPIYWRDGLDNQEIAAIYNLKSGKYDWDVYIPQPFVSEHGTADSVKEAKIKVDNVLRKCGVRLP